MVTEQQKRVLNSKMGIYKDEDKLLAASCIARLGFGSCLMSLENIRLFGFMLNQKLSAGANGRIRINF